MHIHDKILSKYFLADDFFQRKAEELEIERKTLIEGAFLRTEWTEMGLIPIGGNVEAIVFRTTILSERMSRLREKRDKAERILEESLKLISKRNSILLNVYYRKGLTLTSNKELIEAKNTMIEALERIKDKEDRSIKREYMKQFQ